MLLRSHAGIEKFIDPWLLLGQTARVIPLFGGIYSMIDASRKSNEGTNIEPFLAENIWATLVLLGQESNDPVTIVLNNSGGSVRAGFTIIDGIRHLQAKGITVRTLVLQSAMSMASAVLISGTKGHRYAFNESLIHLHPPFLELKVENEKDKSNILRFQERGIERFYELFAAETKIPEYALQLKGVPLDKEILTDIEKRKERVKKFMSCELLLNTAEALQAEIIDKVITPGDRLIDDIFSFSSKKGDLP